MTKTAADVLLADAMRIDADDRDRWEEPEQILPSQWWGAESNESPSRTFLRVVLASGLHELALYPKKSEEHEAARAWLLEDDDNGNICSFVQLCSVFGLDHGAVRAKVLERLAARTLAIPREARTPNARPKQPAPDPRRWQHEAA